MALRLWNMGFAVICPHMNTFMFDGAAPDRVWLDGDLVMQARCDATVVLSGWERSSGTKSEMNNADVHDQPVFFEEDCGLFTALERFRDRWIAEH